MASLLRSMDASKRSLASTSPQPATALPTSASPTTAPTFSPTTRTTTFSPTGLVVTTSVANGWSILLPILGISFLAWIARKKDPELFSKLGWGTHPVQEVWVDTSKSMHAHNDTVSTLDMQEMHVIVSSNPAARAIRKNTWNSFPDDPVDEVSLKSSDFHVNDDFDDDDEALGDGAGLATNYVRFHM